MSTKQRLAQARKHRDELRDTLAEKVAEVEQLDEQIARKKKARKKHSDDERRRAELHEQIEGLIAERRRAKARVESLEGNLRKAARRARRLARRLRNRVKPKVVDLGLRPNGSLSTQPYLKGTVGHYSAGPIDDDGDDEAFDLWRRYDAYHKSLGWSMIGYNWGVTRDGTIAILRGHGKVGAHTLGQNTGWEGVSVHGTTGDTWTKPQLRAFRYGLKKFGLIDKPVYGHREMPGQSTACPGDFLDGYHAKGR